MVKNLPEMQKTQRRRRFDFWVGREVLFCGMCLRLYDNQSKGSTYKGLIYVEKQSSHKSKTCNRGTKTKKNRSIMQKKIKL